MRGVLAYVDQHRGVFGDAREVLGAGRRIADAMGGAVHALALGKPGLEETLPPLGVHGADEVRVGCHPSLDAFVPEPFARIVADAVTVGRYEVVVFSATRQARDLAPRVAALIGVPLLHDVIDLRISSSGLGLVRPVYGGTATAHVSVDASPILLSLHPGISLPDPRAGRGTLQTFTLEEDPSRWRRRILEFEQGSSGSSDAAVIICGGKGVGGPENWRLLEDLREAFGPRAALIASPAVAASLGRPREVAVAGPDTPAAASLYIAIRASGEAPVLAGMRNAGTVVAIEADRDATIFENADYGLVGELAEILPRLTQAIAARRPA